MQINALGFVRTLWAAVAVVAMLLVGASAYTWTGIDSVSATAADASQRLVPQLARAAAIELNVTRTSLLVRHAMLVRAPGDLQATLAEIGEKRKLVDDATSGFEANVRSPRGKELFATVKLRATDFWKAGEANLALTSAGKKDEAFDHLVATLVPARNAFLTASAVLRDHQQEQLAQLDERIAAGLGATRTVLLSAIAGVVVVLGTVTWLLARALRRRVAQASQVAAQIAAGDLSTPVPVQGRDEFVPLLQQLQQTQSSLQQLVGQVRRSSDSIATASSEIASGNLDLSGRTEQAAGSLQQTASAMEQLTGTVRQTADAARQASQLASSAAKVAARGGDVVAKVVSTMGDINDSSRKIADIVGVIDGIAFQTNILALNAAVEAARAGEQGRGFAVVASEVRSLAQRSSAAAKEIKTLIGNSVEKVQSGTQLVGDAGQTMAEIVGSVQRVADIIGEISAAAAEQSQGIGQVNGSVAQLDQMTQQNAALVEESAAAADSLKSQVQSLTQVVGAFRLTPG